MGDLDDDAVIVTLPPDGEAAVTKVEEAAPVKKTEADESDPIADLKGQFAHMTQRATSAEQANQQIARRLAETEKELQTTKATVTDSQLDTVLSGIQAAEADAAGAEKDYIAAAEAGDFAAQARAQRKMAGAETRIQRLQEAKGDLEEVKTAKAVPRQETRPAPRPQAPDPVETAAQNVEREGSPRSAAWLRAHPDFITDPKKNARMIAAHNMALAEDIPVDSVAYLKHIEEFVGLKAPAKGDEAAPAKVDAVGKRPISAAAPSGQSAGGMNGGGVDVKLSLREKNSAEDGTLVWNYNDPNGKFKKGDPIGVQEMAKRKLAMQKQGLYDRTLQE